MKRYYHYLILVLVSLFIYSCGTTKKERPVSEYNNEIFEASSSELTKAIVSVLSSDDFFVDFASADYGIIKASKKKDGQSYGSTLFTNVLVNLLFPDQENHTSRNLGSSRNVVFYVERVDECSSKVKIIIKGGYVEEDFETNKKTYHKLPVSESYYHYFFDKIRKKVEPSFLENKTEDIAEK